MKSNKTNSKITTMVDGMMTFGETDNGLRILDFMCTECTEVEPFLSDCKVQAMRDGNVYITEKTKRIRNKPLFREDNSTLSLGHDNKYYFVFTIEKRQVKELPDRLVHQALSIAQKVDKMIARRVGKKGSKK